jgi:toxin HigB-1
MRYVSSVIQSFSCRDTEAVFVGRSCPRFRNLRSVLERKLMMLHAAAKLLDLQSPPNNRLEKLTKDLVGSYSIRVNDQFRLVFRWTPQGPADVTCQDYKH